MKTRKWNIVRRADRGRLRVPMKRRNDRRPWFFAGISGAVGSSLMYLFDPEQGRRRRAVGRDRLMGTVRHGVRRFNRATNRLEADVSGLAKRLAHLKPEPKPPANDPTLEQRVQSEILRDQDIPKDRISIGVENGVVTLRGVVDGPEQARHLEERAGKVPGVRGVESYLHPPGTPAPNKEDALKA